jgi:hypothetical protein
MAGCVAIDGNAWFGGVGLPRLQFYGDTIIHSLHLLMRLEVDDMVVAVLIDLVDLVTILLCKEIAHSVIIVGVAHEEGLAWWPLLSHRLLGCILRRLSALVLCSCAIGL